MAEHAGGSPALATTDLPPTSASNTVQSPAESSRGRKEVTGKINSDDLQGESELKEINEEEEEEGGGGRGGRGVEEDNRQNQNEDSEAPSLPDEEVPPLPDEAPPGERDDGWEPVWDANAQAYYFYNRITGVSQWENPRVPEESAAGDLAAPGTTDTKSTAVAGTTVSGYNPAIHGDYDPTAPYAQQYEPDAQVAGENAVFAGDYTASGTFNRFTGRWQASSLAPENFNDENKSRRQMHAYFDVDAAANSHDGRSLKAERSGKKLTKAEVKAFREKRRERKEEKRRAWLRD